MIEGVSAIFGLKAGALLMNLYQESIVVYAQLIWRFIFVTAVLFVAGYSFYKEWKEHKKTLYIPLIFVLIVLVVTTIGTLYDLVLPVVSSGRLEKTREPWEVIDGGNRYKLELENKIEDVDVFFTSYDQNGKHLGRVQWVKYVDYFFKGKTIESRHSLNGAVGRHTIIYKYRTPLWEFFGQQQKALESLQS